MKRKAFIFLIMLIVLPLCGAPAQAQDFWMLKSYKRWTKEEIIRIISDSPWAQVRETEADASQVGFIPMVTIRLRSAVPIRQALVRLKQIEAGYEKMDKNKRAEFDEKTRGLLVCPACQENYVLTISPPISTRRVTSGVYGLKAATLKLLKGKVYLINEKGEKRDLAYFIAPKSDDDEAVFYFPRRDAQGNPFLTNKNEKFTFIFDAENIPIIGGEVRTERRVVTDGTTPVISTDSINVNAKGKTVPRQVVFEVKKLLIDGNVEF